MESEVPQNMVERPKRRSARQSSAKAMNVELTPRGPIKRSKRLIENQTVVTSVNGSKETKNALENEGLPNKKRRLDKGDPATGSSDEDKMDVEETEHLEIQKDQEMGFEEDLLSQQSNHCLGSVQTTGEFGDSNLTPFVLLEHIGSAPHEEVQVQKYKRVEPSGKEQVASSKSAHQLGSEEMNTKSQSSKPISIAEYQCHGVSKSQTSKPSSIAEYQEKMAKLKNSGFSKSTHYVTGLNPSSGVSYTSRRIKKPVIKPGTKLTHGSSSRGFLWYLARLMLLLLLSIAVVLAYKKGSVFQELAGIRWNLSVKVQPGEFAVKLFDLQTQFPSQRPELWKRSRIHLEKHLQTAHPTEPVSLILAAGRKAERTLYCLAQGLASAFAASHNASVLHIDGASKANQDSDQVKLDIDGQLRGAFEGDKPVAVIHRFEELPPGSTLIFYRYCDHENAAYKKVFLAFTVLLPQESLEALQSLMAVEEIVHNYITERFVNSVGRSAFNEMDADKFSGLWSRISHLILPVAEESKIEQIECGTPP